MQTKGFTLIELVVVIIILGILAATVTPKFLSSNDFEEYAYRSEVVSTLRAIQLRAMQQTHESNICHQVNITNDMLGLLATDSGTCGTDWFDDAKYDLNKDDGPTSVQIDSDSAVTFANLTFSFDQMGRPVGCSPCEITIIGDETLVVKIEAEGFIHVPQL